MNDLIGKKGLVIYSEGDKWLECVAEIIGLDNLFIFLKTEKNILVIPISNISKIKFKGGEN